MYYDILEDEIDRVESYTDALETIDECVTTVDCDYGGANVEVKGRNIVKITASVYPADTDTVNSILEPVIESQYSTAIYNMKQTDDRLYTTVSIRIKLNDAELDREDPLIASSQENESEKQESEPMEELIYPDGDTVSDLLNADEYDFHVRGYDEKVTIQLHSNAHLKWIIDRLSENNYSFDLDQGFEVPPRIIIHNRVNPDL